MGVAMDVSALNLKTAGLVLGAGKKVDRVVDVRVPIVGWKGMGMGRARARSLVVVSAAGKKKNHDNPSSSGNGDPSIPEGDGADETNPALDKSKPTDSAHKSGHTLSDWRDFRANLIYRWKDDLLDSEAPTKDKALNEPTQHLGLKWAHPISFPETGCVLVATEKLDGVSSFERTVVLLLRLGSQSLREGPFGVILNRPLNKRIKHMKPSNADLATTFADCPLFFGGPLDASMFLLKTGENSPKTPGFEKVVSGISFGARNSLDEAAALVKKGVLRPQDFRFFVGYAGWQFDQLLGEIANDYWVVAACSSHLISGAAADSSVDLWEEILQLMGGQYSELSRKPKQDSS
ncbi:uncharacterized protein LOC109719867 [Ananas comosus]|uniref:UPF0301 protein n=1 Tax=Ananas comosus TaxID=4615 RepID=A0A199V9W7_ANACO|nr:uncharacterized protein LOC109719867 [Ananas comosus]OAY73902.1 UPF0301 protein [Ananas comosus]